MRCASVSRVGRLGVEDLGMDHLLHLGEDRWQRYRDLREAFAGVDTVVSGRWLRVKAPGHAFPPHQQWHQTETGEAVAAETPSTTSTNPFDGFQ